LAYHLNQSSFDQLHFVQKTKVLQQ
jgi:hypothetical protein